MGCHNDLTISKTVSVERAGENEKTKKQSENCIRACRLWHNTKVYGGGLENINIIKHIGLGLSSRSCILLVVGGI